MPEIDSWDNRAGSGSTADEAYGYVYFSDGSRVGYAPGLPNRPDVWQPRSNGGGKYRPVSTSQLIQARDFLVRQGVPVRTVGYTER